jgi:predicted Zn finger-like uncharacterized protein
MRLGCPNCDAQYEVDDAAIPAAGRDVQCSNCGHIWFQTPAGTAAAVPPAPPRPAPRARPTAAPPRPAAAAPPQPAAAAPPHPDPEPAPVAVPEAVAEPAPPLPPTDAPAAAAAAPGARRSLDENLMSILREEAAREAAERKAEAERALQVQPDLGVPEADRRPPPRPENARFADLSEDAAPDPEPPRTRPPSRRTLLPDIEEINSTLRPGTEQRDGDDSPAFTEAAERRRGFGAGFFLVLLVAAAAFATYVLAPRLAEAVPQLADPLQAYVGAVDAGRLWLDETLKKATGALQGLSGEGGTPPG